MLLISILAFGLIIRLINLNQSLWLDEAINILAVQNYSFFDLITGYLKGDFHPPGWSVILWLWTQIFGISEVSIRMPSVIFGVLTIFIVYLIGKKLLSEKLGIIAALLICLNPLHIFYSQEARMYSMATLAVSINILLFIKYLKSDKVSYLSLSASNFFVLMSDYLAYFIFPAQFIIMLLINKKIGFKWVGSLIIAGILSVWWIPVFVGQFNTGSIAAANLPTWKFVVGAFDFKTLPLTSVKFIIGRISIADKILYALVLLPIMIFYGFLLWRGFKESTIFAKKLLFGWISIPLIIATLISFVIPIYNYFRVLYVLPGFFILLSLGIMSLRKRLKIVFLFTVIFIELFSSSVYLFNPSFHREDWKGLVNFFENKPADYVILFESSGILPPFDYYAQNKLKAVGALKDFPVDNENGLIDLENITQKSKSVYLVDYLVGISDPKRLVSRKLTELGYRNKEIYNFTGLGFIYLYQR